MRISTTLLPPLALAISLTCVGQDRQILPVGTNVTVRTNETVDMKNASDGRIFYGVVDRDVRAEDGRVAIARGSNCELIVRNISQDELALDLESITVDGRRYLVSTTDQTYSADRKSGVGANSRTGKYVGGGAVVGAIIGAIAGGGKGAAIGAAAGGATGAGAETVTRGSRVRVPAESLLTFRLDRELRVRPGADNGFERDGRHYHEDWNRDQDRERNRYRQ